MTVHDEYMGANRNSNQFKSTFYKEILVS